MPNDSTKKDIGFFLRLSRNEKKAFQEASEIAGVPLSSWVRERLRLAAIRELEAARIKVPFVKPLPLENPDG